MEMLSNMTPWDLEMIREWKHNVEMRVEGANAFLQKGWAHGTFQVVQIWIG